jgi:hypothetical protein
VIIELGQGAVELSAVARTRNAGAGVTVCIDRSKTVDQRHRPGPRPLVDGRIEAELGEVQRRRLKRQRHVDIGPALVCRKADIDAGRHARSETRDTATGCASVAEKLALVVGA